MIRMAISPRLAIRSFFSMRSVVIGHRLWPALQWYIPMLPGRVRVPLVLEHIEGVDQARPRLARVDDIIYISSCRRYVGVRELLAVLCLELRGQCLGVIRCCDLSAEEDLDRALRAHHRDLGGRPGEVDITPYVLGVHDVVCAPVCLPGDQGDSGHGRLGEGVEEFGAMADDPPMLLADSG